MKTTMRSGVICVTSAYVKSKPQLAKALSQVSTRLDSGEEMGFGELVAELANRSKMPLNQVRDGIIHRKTVDEKEVNFFEFIFHKEELLVDGQPRVIIRARVLDQNPRIPDLNADGLGDNCGGTFPNITSPH